MQLKHAFDVALPPQEAWKVLLDVERIAPCMPGAELTEVVGDGTYKGKVSVRLGPVTLTFNGVASIEAVDEDNKRAQVKAQGTDTRGRGGANALTTFRIEPSEKGSRVLVDTDLNLSGSVAQYGRAAGMIQSVAEQLIGQFARNLEVEIVRPPAGAEAEPMEETGASGPAAGAMPSDRPADTTRRQAKPISGLALFWAALKNWLRRTLGR